ncbi:rCG59553 [Rattus norvegicus]|uniref:RCG59553 n=1 Tax=Rattus norvegicus TaxID=10116 RepID=A6HSG0_RAT|nr:rCG59553 [Rattus norvegicus]
MNNLLINFLLDCIRKLRAKMGIRNQSSP